MRVRAGCEREFEAAWQDSATGIGAFEGNRGQWLLRPDDDTQRYVIMSDWETAADLARFESDPLRKQLSARLIPLRESAEKSVLALARYVASADVPPIEGK